MSSEKKVWHRSNFVHTEVPYMYFCAFKFEMRKNFNEDSNIIAGVGKGTHVQNELQGFTDWKWRYTTLQSAIQLVRQATKILPTMVIVIHKVFTHRAVLRGQIFSPDSSSYIPSYFDRETAHELNLSQQQESMTSFWLLLPTKYWQPCMCSCTCRVAWELELWKISSMHTSVIIV